MDDKSLVHENAREAYLAIRTIIELTKGYDLLDDVLSRHFARFGLTRAKFNALMQLRNAGETGLSLSELSDRMLVSRANITGLVDRMAKDGLVTREMDPRDRRVFRATMTEKSRRLVDFILPLHTEFSRQALSRLTAGEKEQLITLLQKLSRGLEQK